MERRSTSRRRTRLPPSWPRFSIALTDLPQLRITTRNGVPIESKEVYVDATYVLTNPAAAVTGVALNGKIRGRGNTTWGQPKSPYKVQFSNDASYAAISDVLGMKKQRNWALLADYFDRSLIRNKLALSLGSSSVFADGLKWSPSGQHVEVWLNNDYIGVYLLTEDIRIDPARLNLKKMSSTPAAGEVDGGYIVEVDFRLDCYKGFDFTLQLVTPQGVPFCVDTPDEEAITPGPALLHQGPAGRGRERRLRTQPAGEDQPGELRRLVPARGTSPEHRRRLRLQRLHVEGHRGRGRSAGSAVEHGSPVGLRPQRRQRQLPATDGRARVAGPPSPSSPTGSAGCSTIRTSWR